MKFLALVLLVLVTAGCINSQPSGPYQLRECEDFNLSKIPEKEYIETGLITVTYSGLSIALEGACIEGCTSADTNSTKTQKNTPERFHECREVCAPIRTEPVIIFKDQYEPDDPLNTSFLPEGKSPHQISGKFETTSAIEGRSVINNQEFPVYIFLTSADLTYDGKTKLNGNYLMFGFFEINNASKTIEGNVSRIYRDSWDFNKAKPLLMSQLKSNQENFCMDVRHGENISFPITINEISGNADAVDFKMILFDTKKGDVKVYISRETVFHDVFRAFGKAFSLLTIFSDRDYDIVWSNSSKTYKINFNVPENAAKPYSGVLYIRSDNSNTITIPIYINPTNK